MEYQFFTADVFTNCAFEGAQIAVIPNAGGLNADVMQNIANEFNLSETVFVLPLNGKPNERRMKIFSPSGEIDFAGHPIIATAHILIMTGEIPLTGKHTQIILEQNTGPIKVDITEESGKPVLIQFSHKPVPVIDRFVPREQEIADFLGLKVQNIETKKYQPMMVSCGFPYLIVPLTSYDAVRSAKFNYVDWSQTIAPSTSAQEILLFSNQTANQTSDFHGRLVGPNIGIREDPPIGSSMPAFTSYLCADESFRPGTYTFAIDRGTKNNRRSLLHLEMDNKGKNQLDIRVGGQAVLILQGKMNVPNGD